MTFRMRWTIGMTAFGVAVAVYLFTGRIGWAIVGILPQEWWRTQRSLLGTSETGPEHGLDVVLYAGQVDLGECPVTPKM